MIAALLHGRTHLNFHEFRQQNHLTFFLHVLGVLELLQPQVFRSEHQGALWDCLRSFIRLLLVGASRGHRARTVTPPLSSRCRSLGGRAPSRVCTGARPHRCPSPSLPLSLCPEPAAPTVVKSVLFGSSASAPTAGPIHLGQTGVLPSAEAVGRGRAQAVGLQGSWDPAGKQSPLARVKDRAGPAPASQLPCKETSHPPKSSRGSGCLLYGCCGSVTVLVTCFSRASLRLP